MNMLCGVCWRTVYFSNCKIAENSATGDNDIYDLDSNRFAT